MTVPYRLKAQFPQVTRVFDAKRPVDVEVTRKDNKEGTVKDAANCAMARALCREFQATAAVVGLTYSYVVKGNTAVRYRTPVTVQRELTSFDRHQDFRPGRYGLSAMSPSQTLPAMKAKAKARKRLASREGKVRTGRSYQHPKRRVITPHTDGLRVMR